jgi:hypothetical protein
MNFLISLLGFQAQRPLKYSKRQRKLHRNTGADLIFTLDFNALHRVGGAMEAVLAEMKAPFIMIDHHQNG